LTSCATFVSIFEGSDKRNLYLVEIVTQSYPFYKMNLLQNFAVYRSKVWLFDLVSVCICVWASAWNLPLPGGCRIAYEKGLLRIRTQSTENLPEMPQNGAQIDSAVLAAIEVRDTGTTKGFGAFCCVEHLPKHTFLGFYDGIQRESLEGLKNTEYIMTLDGGETYLDGYERAQDRSTFAPVHLNHADKSKCNCVRILEDNRCAFFTARSIAKNEELTFDYGANYWKGREGSKI